MVNDLDREIAALDLIRARFVHNWHVVLRKMLADSPQLELVDPVLGDKPVQGSLVEKLKVK